MFTEQLFKLDIGVDVYNPDIADGLSLKFKRLKNVNPQQGRLKTPTGLSLQQAITGEATPIRSFAYYTIPTSQFTSLYAISNTSIYRFLFNSQSFNPTPIYSSFPSTPDPYAKTPWLDAAYVTKRGGKLVKLQNNIATEIAGAPAGRYMIIADSHLMIANTTSSTDTHPVRIQWSDLYAPESWVISPSSEADFFELSPDDGEVTGLSYQRGATLIYTRDKIWVARYLKGSENSLGRYQFDILFSGVGNLYHNAQIRIKEVDFFIGSDNIYKIDGFQLTEIGDPIWEFFQDTVTEANFQDAIIAIHEPLKYEIYWIYNHVDGYHWSIVYNYKENKWSDRDPQDVYCNINLAFPVRGFLAYEDVPTAYEDMDTVYPPEATYDGEWQFLDGVIRNLYGGPTGQVFVPDTSYIKQDGSAFDCEIETFEFDFDALIDVKEVDRLKLLFSKRANSTNIDSDLVLRIGTRVKRDDVIVWSDPVDIIDMLDNETTFFFRNKGAAKLIRFKFTWTNNEDYAITELVKLSLFKLDQNGNSTPEK